MGDVGGPDEVDSQDAVPVGGLQLPEGEAELPRADRRGEDDVVAAPEGRPDRAGCAPDRLVIGHVGDDAERGAGSRFVRELVGDRGRFRVAVDDRYPGPLRAECRGDGMPEPARPAHHDGHLPIQLEIHRAHSASRPGGMAPGSGILSRIAAVLGIFLLLLADRVGPQLAVVGVEQD
jgi:hypothetical protein